MTTPTSVRRSVLVVQWYVPRYRVSFYEGLRAALDEREIDLQLAYGVPDRRQAARSDAVQLPWATPMMTTVLRVGGRSLEWRSLAGLQDQPDLVVLEQALKNFETYRFLARRARGGAPVALWGHGRTRTKQHSRLEHYAKQALTRRADWFFAYTQSGGDDARAAGVPEERITVVQNASDTRTLARARRGTTAEQVATFRTAHGLTAGRTGLFIGGLDGSKRLPVLFEANRLLRQALPGFRLVVAGDGPARTTVQEEARRCAGVVYLGPVFGDDRAVLGAAADLLVMPGRAGLAVLDGFALGLPVVTSRWPFHPPEIEYVEHGRNGWVVEDPEPAAYAAAVASILGDPALLGRLRTGAWAAGERYTVEEMVRRFAGGVVSALARC